VPLESETGQDVAHVYKAPRDRTTGAQHDRVGCGMSDFLSIPPILGDSTDGLPSVAVSVLSGSSFDDGEGWYHFRGKVSMARGQLSGTDEEMTDAEGPRSGLSIASSTPPLSMSVPVPLVRLDSAQSSFR
jgi:hypothetical protein